MSKRRKKTTTPNSKTHEDEGEYVELYDRKTGGIIYCATRSHFQNKQWCVARNVTNLLDVIHDKPFVANRGEETITFERDDNAIVKPADVNKHMQLLVDLVCLMYFHLDCSDNVAVFCKNGRSRSPTTILAYYMMVGGYSREHAMHCIERAFHAQRPSVARHYANFPNYTKFLTLMVHFENVLDRTRKDSTSTWVCPRVRENCLYINMILKQSHKKEYKLDVFYDEIIGKIRDVQLLRRSREKSNQGHHLFLHPSSFIVRCNESYSCASSSMSRCSTFSMALFSASSASSVSSSSSASSASSSLSSSNVVQRKSSRNRTASTTKHMINNNTFPEFIEGRRVRSWWDVDHTNESISRWFVGTLTRFTDTNKCFVTYDDGSVINESMEQLAIAFRSGTPVVVHFSSVPKALIDNDGGASPVKKMERSKTWQFQNKESRSGIVLKPNGLFVYVVRLDEDGRTYEVHGKDLALFDPSVYDDAKLPWDSALDVEEEGIEEDGGTGGNDGGSSGGSSSSSSKKNDESTEGRERQHRHNYIFLTSEMKTSLIKRRAEEMTNAVATQKKENDDRCRRWTSSKSKQPKKRKNEKQ